MQRANGRAAGDTPARGTGIFPAGRGYSRWAGEYPRRPGMFSMGREYSRGRGYSRWAGPGIFPPAGDIPNGGRGYSPPARDMTDRAGNIPAGRGYSQWGPGISPPAGDIPDGPGDIPAGRGYSRSGREYSRRPGIFPTGPRIRGSRERSRSPAGIFPAGRGYPRLARGHYHELAALKVGDGVRVVARPWSRDSFGDGGGRDWMSCPKILDCTQYTGRT